MARGAVETSDVPCIVAVKSNGELDLRQLHKTIPPRCSRRGQGHDDVAVKHSGKKQRAHHWRIIATNCQRISRLDPPPCQLARPGIGSVTKPAERPTFAAPYQRRSVPPRMQSPD